MHVHARPPITGVLEKFNCDFGVKLWEVGKYGKSRTPRISGTLRPCDGAGVPSLPPRTRTLGWRRLPHRSPMSPEGSVAPKGLT